MKNKNQYTIVGWGLAGATLAWHLYHRNIAFEVIDKGKNHSSRVAAGIANPIVFKRLTQSWKASVLMPYAYSFYSEIETLLGVQLLSQKKICRLFANTEEVNNWSVLMGDDRFAKLLNKPIDAPLKFIKTPFGRGEVNTFGNLNVNLFLDQSKSFLEDKGISFKTENFNYEKVEGEIVFCEGSGVMTNPWFSYLPMKPAHGETLVIRANFDFEDKILNRNMFVLPLGNGLYKIGSTYNWDETNPVTTKDAILKLDEIFKGISDIEYEIVRQEAGIRPTVKDRRPWLGTHPEHKNLHIFNGLGTKGVMIGPLYANHLVEYLLEGKALEPEVDINRHLDLFLS